MKSDKEKMTELLEDIGVTCEVEEGIDSFTGGRIVDIKGADYVADHLLSHGVTFAKDTDVPSKWISVDEPPKDRRDVLVCAFWHETWQSLPGWYAPASKTWHVITAVGDKTDLTVTHWQELPQPPREE